MIFMTPAAIGFNALYADATGGSVELIGWFNIGIMERPYRIGVVSPRTLTGEFPLIVLPPEELASLMVLPSEEASSESSFESSSPKLTLKLVEAMKPEIICITTDGPCRPF
jgi:hypothetical protein